MKTTTAASSPLYDAVVEAHSELLRYAARTATDWQRDGYGIHAAQTVVDAARRRYMEAYSAYATYPRSPECSRMNECQSCGARWTGGLPEHEGICPNQINHPR